MASRSFPVKHEVPTVHTNPIAAVSDTSMPPTCLRFKAVVKMCRFTSSAIVKFVNECARAHEGKQVCTRGQACLFLTRRVKHSALFARRSNGRPFGCHSRTNLAASQPKGNENSMDLEEEENQKEARARKKEGFTAQQR